MNTTSFDAQWHVVYTRPQSERKVASSIEEMGMESYLPLHKVIRRWSDRRKKMEIPLFPNYVFVKVDRVKRMSLYNIKELVNFVAIDKKPVIIAEKEIVTIKRVLGEEVMVSSEEYFQEGVIVRMTHGPLAGLEGLVVKKNSNARLVIKIDGLMKAFSFNVPSHWAEVVVAEAMH
jgi:transcription antitermination factor NusG